MTLTSDDLDAISARVLTDGVRLADAVAHGGTPGASTATLALAKGRFSNSDGDPALRLECTGAGGAGLHVQGTGASAGAWVQGGADGSGLVAFGLGTGSGLKLLASGTGEGVDVAVGSGIGVRVEGGGVRVEDGGVRVTDSGGPALWLVATGGNTSGIRVTGHGTAPGALVESTGPGVQVLAGGSALWIEGGAAGAAVFVASGSGQNGVIVVADNAGVGVEAPQPFYGFVTAGNSPAVSLDASAGGGTGPAVLLTSGGAAGLQVQGGVGAGDIVLSGDGTITSGVAGEAVAYVNVAAGGIAEASITPPAEAPGPPAGVLSAIMWLVARLGLRRVERTATEIIVYLADGVTPATSQAYAPAGSAEDVGPAT